MQQWFGGSTRQNFMYKTYVLTFGSRIFTFQYSSVIWSWIEFINLHQTMLALLITQRLPPLGLAFGVPVRDLFAKVNKMMRKVSSLE